MDNFIHPQIRERRVQVLKNQSSHFKECFDDNVAGAIENIGKIELLLETISLAAVDPKLEHIRKDLCIGKMLLGKISPDEAETRIVTSHISDIMRDLCNYMEGIEQTNLSEDFSDPAS